MTCLRYGEGRLARGDVVGSIVAGLAFNIGNISPRAPHASGGEVGVGVRVGVGCHPT